MCQAHMIEPAGASASTPPECSTAAGEQERRADSPADAAADAAADAQQQQQQPPAPAAAGDAGALSMQGLASLLESDQQLQALHTGEQAAPSQPPSDSDAAPQPESAPDPADDHATLFFAKVPRSASRDQVEQLFAAFGEVVSLNLFVPYEGAPASKGCGLVVMRDVAAASAAIAGLEKFTWEGMHSAMVLKLMVPGVQRRPDEGGSGGNSPHVLNRSPTTFSHPGSSSTGFLGRGASPATHHSRMGGGGGSGMDVPPAGCGPDAYKLFVGNIPKMFTEADLLPVFESVGGVKELVILRDRQTQESKGSAFLWYASGADADQACLQFNMRLVLQAPGGAPSRPLVVRRAVTHKPACAGVAVPQHQRAWLGDPFGALLPEHASFVPVAPMRGGLDGGGVMQQMQMLQGGCYMQAQPAYAAAPQLQPATYSLVPQQLWAQQGAPQQLGYAGVEQQQFMPPGVMAPVPAMSPAAPQYALVPAADHSPRVQEGGLGPASSSSGLQAYSQLALPQCSMPLSASLAFADGSPQQLGGGSPQLSGSMLSAPAAVQSGGSYPLLSAPAPGAVGSPSLVGAQHLQQHTAAGGYQPQSAYAAGGGAVAQQQQQHSVSIPITAGQISALNLQLSGVSAMSGATIRAEQDLACGSLALVITAASSHQLAVAWQLVQGILAGQAAAGAGQQAEVVGQA